jgi:hypothetical protein
MRSAPRKGTAALLSSWLLEAAIVAATAASPGAKAPPKAPSGPAPLTNEDIVRLTAYGTSEANIIKEINARTVDFELDAGVVAELERVGVTTKVLEAMRKRQAEAPARRDAPPPPPAEPVPESAAPPARLTLAFDDAAAASDTGHDESGPQVYALAALPKGAPRPKGAEIDTVDELAIAVLCTTGDHVPDHWDTRTPLKDAPRHELLAFRAGTTKRKEHGFDVLALDRAPLEPITLPAGSHSLIVALAGRQNGSGAWRLLASDSIRVTAEPGKPLPLLLDARTGLKGSRMIGFDLNMVWKVRTGPEASPGTLAAPAGQAQPAAAPPPAAAPGQE